MTLLSGGFDAWTFVFDPEWALAVLLFGAWYLWAAHVMSAPLWRRACFLLGLLLIALALLSPIEHVALDSMLSFHLLQNVMLADWAPPLLVLGVTPAMAAAAERRAWVRTVTRPAVALPCWLAVWYVVHIPAVYGYGLDHRWSLGIEHLLFITAGLAFWWPVLVPGRMPPMAKLVYLAAAFFLAAPVALLIALASSTIYPYYDTTPHLFGLTPRDDQQLGGILMAVEQSLILFLVFSLAFRELLEADERLDSRLMDRITAACVQFSASRDKDENIARMAVLVEEAAARGARLVLLPEKWNAIADGRELLTYAESLEDGGDTLDALSEWARRLQLDLICGSIAIADGDRVGNVSIAFSPSGERVAAYTKIHLFDVDVGGISYRESDGTSPGGELVMANMSGLPVGLSVCYDLRFPEMYRALEQAGALVLTVPAAFTLFTGMAHWEPLLRARAIENQAFVLASNQHSDPGGYGMPRFGHSMIIDPWGTVIAQAGPVGDGVIVAELDLAAQRSTRGTLPALDHRRPDAYTVADTAFAPYEGGA